MLLEKIREFKNKIENEKLTQELANRKQELRQLNMINTLNTLANYLVADQLERTGILYSPADKYIQTKVQQLFFEWKDEGLINEFEDFSDTTKTWIENYA